VRGFLSRLTRPAEHAALDEIEGLVALGKERWTLDLARAGSIVIVCSEDSAGTVGAIETRGAPPRRPTGGSPTRVAADAAPDGAMAS
jgi:hypothetical protein